jgi:tetratricopeptide (TPR) repeat protein
LRSYQDFSIRLLAEAQQAYQIGELARADELCRQTLAVRHNDPDAFNLLGAIYHSADRLEDAIVWLRRAVQAEPGNPHYHNNLGVYCTHAGRLGEAVACYQHALRLQPDFAEFHNNLAFALYSLGRNEEAQACGEQALRLRPDFAEAHNHLGLALMELNRAEQAVEHFRRAVRLQSRLPAVHRNLGNALRELGQLSEAIAEYQEALRLDPNFADVHCDMGEVLKVLGRFDESMAHFREALRINPDDALAYWNLNEFAGHGMGSLSERELGHLQALAESDRLSILDRSVVHMTLGRTFDRRGEWDTAFSHYRQGNTLRKDWLSQTGRNFDVPAHRAMIGRLIHTFDERFFQQKRPSGSDSELPVFVVGMPRSGTSLVQQILSAHSQVAGANELWDISQIVMNLERQAKPDYPGCLDSMPVSRLRELAGTYLARLSRTSGSAARIIDKMPQNFLHLGVIAVLFPRCRIIHCRRDPLDVCLSCYFQNFNKVGFSWSLEDLGHYYVEYERLMAHWQRVLPLQIMEVNYEDLVARQEAVSRKLVAFCGLDWEDHCLAFHQSSQRVNTASAIQVRQPMYSSSVGRSQKYATHLEPLRRVLSLATANDTETPGSLPIRPVVSSCSPLQKGVQIATEADERR